MNGEPKTPDTDRARRDDAAAGDAAASEAGPGDAGAGADAAPGAAGREHKRSGWRELPVLLVIALIVALVIKTFVVQAFYIPSGSMEKTLLIGDKILVNKLVYHVRSIQPGDIVVFNGQGSWDPSPRPARPAANPVARAYDATLRPLLRSIAGLFGTPVGQTDYVKRVIGVPGDRVACCTAQGLVTVNGVPLHERSYLYPGNSPSQIRFSIIVPPGRLWVMGDHRAISDDSRLHRSSPGGGTIPESKVIGRAFVIAWPPSQWRILPIPATFGQSGIARSAGSAGADSAGADSAKRRDRVERVTAALDGARIAPEQPLVPLTGGLVFAVPVTWVRRRRLVRRKRQGDRRADGAGGPDGA